MSAFFLFFLLLFTTTFIYIVTKRDLINPAFIVSAVFTLSSMFTLLNVVNWKVNYGITTIITVLFSILAFFFGEEIACNVKISNPIKIKQAYYREPGIIEIRNLVLFGLVTLCIVGAVLYFLDRIRLAAFLGGGNSFFSMVSTARHVELYTEESMASNVGRLVLIIKCVSYTLTYVFVNNIIIDKIRVKYFKYLIPLFIYGVIQLLSGGRMEFIHIIAYIVILYTILFYKVRGLSNALRVKIVKNIIRAFTAFFAIFIFLGFSSKKIVSGSVFSNISIYVGSSINALDLFLKKGIPEEHIWGQETLIPLYSTLRKFGYFIDTKYMISAREFVSMNGVETNIYTALRRYIRDYNYIGCFIIMFLMGFFYSKFYSCVQRKKASSFSIILYASIFFPLVEMSIEERFFLKVLTMGEIYEIILYFLLYRFVLRKPLKTRKYVNSYE